MQTYIKKRPSLRRKGDKQRKDRKVKKTMAENGNVPVSPHSEAALGLLQQIRAILETIGSTTLVDNASQRRLSALAGMSDEQIEAAAVAMDANPQLAATSEFTSAQLRDAVAYSRAYRPLVQEFRLGATKLMQKIVTIRAEAGLQASKIYNIAKNLNRLHIAFASANLLMRARAQALMAAR